MNLNYYIEHGSLPESEEVLFEYDPQIGRGGGWSLPILYQKTGEQTCKLTLRWKNSQFDIDRDIIVPVPAGKTIQPKTKDLPQ